MDVSGRAPTGEAGVYFRNSVWSWRPLWDYCCELLPELELLSGHTNDGEGPEAALSLRLADALDDQLRPGEVNGNGKPTASKCQRYADARKATLEAMPDVTCRVCLGSGKRPGPGGLSDFDPIRTLRPYQAEVKAGTPYSGPYPLETCNGCEGKGTVRPWDDHYPFDVENVQEFAIFVRASGGFEIF